jgi:hypothetical protein
MIRPSFEMHQDRSYPAGAYLDEHWLETGNTDFGLIAVPDSPEPVVVEWIKYACPKHCHEPEYVAVFWHGSKLLLAREHYQQVLIEGGVRYCRRFRYAHAGGVCCTELVLELAAGRPLKFERIEQGAYTGLWRGDARPHPGRSHRGRVEDMACRVVLDLGRAQVLLFRRRTLAPRAR